MRYQPLGGIATLTLCGLSVATACIAGPQAIGGAAPESGSACLAPWRTLGALRGDGRDHLYLASAQIVDTPWGILLIDGPLALTRSSQMEDSRGSVGLLLDRDFRVRRLAGPESQTRLVYPRGAMDARQRLHLVWGEGHDVIGEYPRIARLMHAMFDGRRWTTPNVILETPAIPWYPTSTSRVAPMGNGVVVVVGVELPGQAKQTSVAMYLDSAWVIRQVMAPPWASYPEVLEAVDGRLVLAFVGLSLDSTPDQNSLFVTTSSDSGRSWPVPTRVHRGGRGGAHWPRLLVGDSALYLAWNQDVEAGLPTGALGLAITHDTGRTWQSQAMQLIAPGVSHAEWSIADGVPHATVDTFTRERLLHYAWNRTRWEECQRPPSGESMGHTMASVRGRLLLLANEPPQKGRRAFSTLYSLP